jgi:hypothetical protein
MERIEEFTDERNKSWCIHCGRSLVTVETNLDHVPTKSLLTKPRPHHLPVVEICRECNNGFSRDEQYFVTFLSCVLSGSVDPAKQPISSAARALTKSAGLASLMERAKREYRTRGGEDKVFWVPDMERVHRVVLKNARGHAYYEFGEPMLDEPVNVWASPLEFMTASERADFEGFGGGGLVGLPEVGSRMMTRVFSGLDLSEGWISVQAGRYRYSVEQDGGIVVRSIIAEYLATEVRW